MQTSRIKIIIASALAVSVEISSATSAGCLLNLFPDSLMLNVSTAGWASKDEPVMACTIINPLVKSHGVAFFSETANEDAVIEVKYVEKKFPIRTGDDWKIDVPASQQVNLRVNPRIPARETDAAVILHTDPTLYPAVTDDSAIGYANYRFGVCAFGYPKSGRAWTSVSITSLKSFSCPWLGTIPAVNYFER